MKIKNGKLVMYDISEEYKKYLRQFDTRVSEKEERKFYGILLIKDNMDYYIPFTSKVNKKTSSKLTVNIKDERKATIAKLLLNNMIPVNEKDSYVVNINKSKYKDYFNKEIIYLRKERVVKEIIKKVENIFKVLNNPKDNDYEFFKKLCCDFRFLEEKCLKYNERK